MYNVGLVYNKPKEMTSKEKELDPRSYRQPEIIAKSIKEALESRGHTVKMIPGSYNLIQDIKEAGDLDVIFNSCTGINNKTEQANIVAILELMNIPFVGSGLDTQTIALHKGHAKAAFDAAGVPVSPFQVLIDGDEELNDDLEFPLFVKPEGEGSGVGITMDSIVHNEEELRKKANEIIEDFKQPALVEGFLPGREFTVGVVGTKDPKVLPICEITFAEDSDAIIQTVDTKADNEVIRVCPPDISTELEEEISDCVLKAYKALNCSEYARIDTKLDEDGRVNIIELNSLPALEPDHSHFSHMVRETGHNMADLVEKLVEEAMDAWEE